MITRFLESWSLFGETYMVGIAIAATLSLVGVWVVARNQIFLGVAVSQASTLGVALALWLGNTAAALHFLHGEWAPAVLAIGASVTTAWLAVRGEESRAESSEAVTGWVFLLAASVPVLMVAHSPHGLEEVHRLMFSTLLAASRIDLLLFGGLALATAGMAFGLRERLLLMAMDPELAATVGLHRARWHAATAIWLGVAVGLSIRVSGLIYTFGCLVLPALVAKSLCREVRPMLVLAPVIGIAASLVGFVLSNDLDLPPAHTSVALLTAALPAAWAVRALRRRGSGDRYTASPPSAA